MVLSPFYESVSYRFPITAPLRYQTRILPRNSVILEKCEKVCGLIPAYYQMSRLDLQTLDCPYCSALWLPCRSISQSTLRSSNWVFGAWILPRVSWAQSVNVLQICPVRSYWGLLQFYWKYQDTRHHSHSSQRFRRCRRINWQGFRNYWGWSAYGGN